MKWLEVKERLAREHAALPGMKYECEAANLLGGSDEDVPGLDMSWHMRGVKSREPTPGRRMTRRLDKHNEDDDARGWSPMRGANSNTPSVSLDREGTEGRKTVSAWINKRGKGCGKRGKK